MNELWRELAATQGELEQVRAKLAAFAAKHTRPDCDCEFCWDLRAAADLVEDAITPLSEAVAAEREHAPGDDDAGRGRMTPTGPPPQV